MKDNNHNDETLDEENEYTPETLDEEGNPIKKTKFQSPVPFLKQLRNLIFGKRIPDIYTRITFYINAVLWTTFMLWNIIGYFTLTSRDLLTQQKGIRIEYIIQRRGAELGFTGNDFVNRLETFHGVSMVVWLVALFGLILLFRKQRRYIYFVLGPVIFYIGMNIFYVSFDYFIEDTTTYDKVALLIMIVSTLVHSYLLKLGGSGQGVGFFGETIEEDA